MSSAAPAVFQSLATRTAIILSFWAAILISVPFWLRTTTILRLPLPLYHVARSQSRPTCPVHFHASLRVSIAPGLVVASPPASASTSASHHIRHRLLDSLDLNTRRPGSHPFACTSWTVDVIELADAQPSSSSLRSRFDYDFLVIPDHYRGDPVETRQSQLIAWPNGDPNIQPTPDAISATVVQRLAHLLGQDAFPIESLHPGEAVDSRTAEQDPRVIQYSKDVRLIFSLMNEDVSQGDAWSSEALRSLHGGAEGPADPAAFSDPIAPITALVKELRGLHDFHIESQVQWFAPLHFSPTIEEVEEKGETLVEEEYLEEVEEEVEEDVPEPEPEQQPKLELEPEQAKPAPSSVLGEDATKDEAEVERLIQSVDDLKTKEAEAEALLGGADEPATETQPPPPSVTTRPKRKRIVKRLVPRVRMAPRTEIRKHVRHLVEWDDLKVFVNSAEWSLSSTVLPQLPGRAEEVNRTTTAGEPEEVRGQTHDLHFILYVPSASHRPLQIRDPETGDASESNAWLVPQWGGVVILNPPTAAAARDGEASSAARNGGSRAPIQQLPEEQLRHAMELFKQQLEVLIGLPERDDESAAEDAVVRKARIDALVSKRILENAREAVETLGGIVRLVDKIENLGVGYEIQQDVKRAIGVLDSLETHLSTTPLDRHAHLVTALHLSHQASTLASRAFFSPTMLGLLYFPDEHKYAVYTPLFGPLLVPLFVTLVRCLREWMRRSGGRGTKKRDRRKNV
ncbi:hypothetical protein ACQY0O_004459 [Thecaphora frezii]